MNLLSILQNVWISSHPKPWKLQKPRVIQFPVNDVCNSRCQMCSIWEQKFDYQITPNQLERVLSNNLFSEVTSVGINGGEPTLRKDLAELIDVLFQKLPKLSSISLITNSFNSTQVIERITEVGEVIKLHNGNLDVMVSLDGVGEVHDRVRGRQGNFDNAIKVINFIHSSKLVSSSRLGCTVIKENVYGVEDLLEFAINKDIYIKYRLGIPHQRLYSKDVIEPFDLTFEEKYHFAIFLENLIRFYEKSEQQSFFYKSLIGQLVYKKARAAGCDWQHRGATLSARGELLYCAVESKTLGSAINDDPEKLYFDNQWHLSEIVKTKCDTCSHDYVGTPPINILLKHYTKKILEKSGVFSPVIKLKLMEVKALKSLKHRMSFNKRMAIYGLNTDKLSFPQPALRFKYPNSQNRKVLICGWYGTETLGDKAILGGVINALRYSLETMELHLASLEPYISQMTIHQMPELQGCKLHTITEAIEVVSSMDLVVFGGGPLMALSVLADMIAIFQQATKAKVPTLIAGCGVGPLGHPIYNTALKHLMLHSSHRIYRDSKSREIAALLGIETSADQVAEDPAFTWLSNCIRSGDESPNQVDISKPLSLLLGLRDWPYQEYAGDLTVVEAKNLKAKFEAEILTTLERLVDKYPGIKIIPFPMCTNHIGHDDRWFYRRLFKNKPKIYESLDISYLGREVSPLEAVNVFKSASVALTMRFHSLVFALSCGIPAIAIDYTLGRGKVKSLAEKYQVPHMSLESVNNEFMFSCISDFLDRPSDTCHYINNNKQSLNFTKAVRKFIESLDS